MEVGKKSNFFLTVLTKTFFLFQISIVVFYYSDPKTASISAMWPESHGNVATFHVIVMRQIMQC